MRVRDVVLCPDTLHPLLSFAFRKGILDLHVTREFWKKDLEGGDEEICSLFLVFFLLLIWTVMGGANTEALFWAGFHENISRHPYPFSCAFSGVNYVICLVGPLVFSKLIWALRI